MRRIGWKISRPGQTIPTACRARSYRLCRPSRLNIIIMCIISNRIHTHSGCARRARVSEKKATSTSKIEVYLEDNVTLSCGDSMDVCARERRLLHGCYRWLHVQAKLMLTACDNSSELGMFQQKFPVHIRDDSKRYECGRVALDVLVHRK